MYAKNCGAESLIAVLDPSSVGPTMLRTMEAEKRVTSNIAVPSPSCAASALDKRPARSSFARKLPKYHPTVKVPEGYGDSCMDVTDGVYVFKPSAETFEDFAKFLITVEEIAGREQGVVKAVVPQEW